MTTIFDLKKRLVEGNNLYLENILTYKGWSGALNFDFQTRTRSLGWGFRNRWIYQNRDNSDSKTQQGEQKQTSNVSNNFSGSSGTSEMGGNQFGQNEPLLSKVAQKRPSLLINGQNPIRRIEIDALVNIEDTSAQSESTAKYFKGSYIKAKLWLNSRHPKAKMNSFRLVIHNLAENKLNPQNLKTSLDLKYRHRFNEYLTLGASVAVPLTLWGGSESSQQPLVDTHDVRLGSRDSEDEYSDDQYEDNQNYGGTKKTTEC